MSGSDGRYPPIASHGIIGDLQTAALVNLNGSIDFLCLPHFDSPSIFAALLDEERGGVFEITPELEEPRYKQLYVPGTNLLLTRFLCDQGIAEISDFMPVHPSEHSSRVVRRVKTVRGEIRFRVRCAPRFDYGRARHTLELAGAEARMTGADGTVVRLTSSIPLRTENADAVGEFTLPAGQTATFILEHVSDRTAYQTDLDDYVSGSFKETMNFWREWLGRSSYSGRWRDGVHRSALTLKLLHARGSGAIVAAATFGLPEAIGGRRNWGYRYSWIRDASFTMYALDPAGHDCRIRLVDRLAGPALRLLPTGEPPDDVHHRRWIGADRAHALTISRGIADRAQVRIGNAASDQLQLDIYGELLDAIYLYDKYGRATSHDLWQRIAGTGGLGGQKLAAA